MGREQRNEFVEAALGELKDQFGEIADLLAREGGSAGGKASGEVGISMSDFQTALELEAPAEDVRDSQFVDGRTTTSSTNRSASSALSRRGAIPST